MHPLDAQNLIFTPEIIVGKSNKSVAKFTFKSLALRVCGKIEPAKIGPHNVET